MKIAAWKTTMPFTHIGFNFDTKNKLILGDIEIFIGIFGDHKFNRLKRNTWIFLRDLEYLIDLVNEMEKYQHNISKFIEVHSVY